MTPRARKVANWALFAGALMLFAAGMAAGILKEQMGETLFNGTLV